MGYKCQRAETTFNDNYIVAWFSKDFKISDGPSVFQGLPGLILDMKYGKRIITANAITIDSKKEIIELKPISQITYRENLNDYIISVKNEKSSSTMDENGNMIIKEIKVN